MGRLVVPKLEDGHLPLAACPNDVLEARWIVVKKRCRTEEMPNEFIPLTFTGDEGSEEAEGHGPSLSTENHRARRTGFYDIVVTNHNAESVERKEAFKTFSPALILQTTTVPIPVRPGGPATREHEATLVVKRFRVGPALTFDFEVTPVPNA